MNTTTHTLTPDIALAHYTHDAWPQKTIAARYGVSQMTVSRYLRLAANGAKVTTVRTPAQRRRVLLRHIPPDLAARLLALRREGWGWRRIGKVLAITDRTARRWAAALEDPA